MSTFRPESELDSYIESIKRRNDTEILSRTDLRKGRFAIAPVIGLRLQRVIYPCVTFEYDLNNRFESY